LIRGGDALSDPSNPPNPPDPPDLHHPAAPQYIQDHVPLNPFAA